MQKNIDGQNKAAGAIVELIANSIGVKREVHALTAISTCARLSGSLLFRSFNFDIKDVKPGTAILSEEANIGGPHLVDIVTSVLHSFDISIDNEKMESVSIEESNLDFLTALTKTQKGALEIMKNNGLTYVEMAQACAVSTAFLIQDCKDTLTTEEAFNTAVYAFIELSLIHI